MGVKKLSAINLIFQIFRVDAVLLLVFGALSFGKMEETNNQSAVGNQQVNACIIPLDRCVFQVGCHNEKASSYLTAAPSPVVTAQVSPYSCGLYLCKYPPPPMQACPRISSLCMPFLCHTPIYSILPPCDTDAGMYGLPLPASGWTGDLPRRATTTYSRRGCGRGRRQHG